ncbi:MAG: RlmE family RNA methyltransferase [Desulfobacterales bacterium]|nr:RlmE family RNA methyltransferase [Desulfobacterales bacterium]
MRSRRPKNRRTRNPWADHYTQRARKDKFPARSVYKLQEIQKRFHIIRRGDRVLDLGCAPGAWTQFAAGIAGPGGAVVGIDLKTVDLALPEHVRVLQGDVLAPDAEVTAALAPGFRAVISDMAPATTGHRDVDAARSFTLCEAALNIARAHLQPGGHFVCKIFQGPDFEAFVREVRSAFSTQRLYKPQSSRKASREIFVIGKGRTVQEA